MDDLFKALTETAQKAYYAEMERRDRVLANLRLSLTMILTDGAAIWYLAREMRRVESPDQEVLALCVYALLTFAGIALLVSLSYFRHVLLVEIKLVDMQALSADWKTMLERHDMQATAIDAQLKLGTISPQTARDRVAWSETATRVAVQNYLAETYADAASGNARTNDRCVKARSRGHKTLITAIAVTAMAAFLWLFLVVPQPIQSVSG